MNINETEIMTAVEKYLEENYFYTKEDGYFKVTLAPDYRDTLDRTSVIEFLKQPAPRAAMLSALEEAYCDALNQLQEDTEKAIFEELYADEPDVEDAVRAAVRDLCIFTPDIDHFLQMKFPVNIYLDTGDGTTDYVLNSHYPHWGEDMGKPFDPAASLVWLAEQQGYTKEELESAMDKGDCHNPHGFLETARVEEANANSHMLTVGFMVMMALDDIMDLNESLRMHEHMTQAKKAVVNPSYVVIDKDTTCGLMDPWDGGGGVLGLELERDVKVPLDIIRSAMPDGGDGLCNLNWYGICESGYKPLKSMELVEPQEGYSFKGKKYTREEAEGLYRLRKAEYEQADARMVIAKMANELMDAVDEDDLPEPGTEEYKAYDTRFFEEHGCSLTDLLAATDIIVERYQDDHDWTQANRDQMQAAVEMVISEICERNF